jgi:hypothetical protein
VEVFALFGQIGILAQTARITSNIKEEKELFFEIK